MQTGTINVQTENIFPIIKKFLYSDTDIFLRELVSNAVDATQKLKALSSLGEFKGELGELKVEVVLDKENKTITIKDNGIGMTDKEINKYINEVAFSGAEEFVKKYKNKLDEKNAIIGHFGLGFYSSFMVSKKVEIITQSYKNAKSVKWSCDGSPEFTIDEIEKRERGTDIVLHIADDSLEYLEEFKISEILNKYCKFLPVPIIFGTTEETIKNDDGKEEKITKPKVINNTSPLWTKTPVDLKDEDYKNFYNELYPFTEDPLFHIHLNVDYPFNLTGILYFPKLKKNLEIQKNKIQLYSNQVFITDNVENIVPEFLTLLHGVIDSPDIPLNVSRSYLQSDSNVKKISNHITKKVADKLEEMFKKDRADFQTKWDDVSVFIHYGMLTDEKFNERADKFNLLKNTKGEYFTLEEYKEKIKATQTNKHDKIVVLYTHDAEEHHSFVENADEKGYDVVILDNPLASHLITRMEQKHTDFSFSRVDADTLEKLIEKNEEIPSKLSEDEQKQLQPIFEKVLPKEKFELEFQSLSEKDAPVTITQAEFMRRMKEQQMTGGGMAMFGNFPEMYKVIINSNHGLISNILKEKDDTQKDAKVKQITDLALLSQNMLKGKDLTGFIKRSFELIK
jgi:molecular chaperone HtpG